MSSEESRRTLKIVNALGLHARAAAKLVQLINRYPSCETTIHRDDLDVNGKSIMGVLMLAAGPGTEIELRLSGADELTRSKLLDEVEALVGNKFGEGR